VAAVAATDVVRELVHRGSVASTQDEALELLRRGARSGLLLVADRQLAGRGRRGRTWDDASVMGASLALTLAIDTPPRGSTLVPHAVGVALHDAITALGVSGLALKWPNDLVATIPPAPGEQLLGVRTTRRHRKIAGILVEREQVDGRDLLLIGVGVNIGDEQAWPASTDEPARPTHPDRVDVHELLRAVGGIGDPIAIDRAGLVAQLVAAMAERLGALHGDVVQLLAAYRERCETIGRAVDVDLPDGTSLQGDATDIDDDGHLVLDVDGARHVVVAATVR
jgi:BirA family biotin operon repressor/biotin-[acetyl-CoA-carboxylase] ligase